MVEEDIKEKITQSPENLPVKNKNELTDPDLLFLIAIHNKHIHLDQLLESRGNILLVVAGLILTFSLTQIMGVSFHNYTLQEFGWIIISLSSLLTIFISIFGIKPKLLVKDKNINLFYYGDFIQKLSKSEYSAELAKQLADKETVIESFTEELYTLAKNVLIPGFRKIRLAYDVFLIGLILGFIVLIVASLVG